MKNCENFKKKRFRPASRKREKKTFRFISPLKIKRNFVAFFYSIAIGVAKILTEAGIQLCFSFVCIR